MIDMKSVALIALLGAGILYMYWQTRRLENQIHALRVDFRRLKSQQSSLTLNDATVSSQLSMCNAAPLECSDGAQCPISTPSLSSTLNSDSREKLLQEEIAQYENQIAHLDTLLAEDQSGMVVMDGLKEKEELAVIGESGEEEQEASQSLQMVESQEDTNLAELEEEVEAHQDTTEFGQDDDLPEVEDIPSPAQNLDTLASSRQYELSTDEEEEYDDEEDLVEDEDTIHIKNIYNKFDDKYTVKQLKELCRKNNLKIQGIKRDLIDRLYKNNILVQN